MEIVRIARLLSRQISLQANYDISFFLRRGKSQVLLGAGLGYEFDINVIFFSFSA